MTHRSYRTEQSCLCRSFLLSQESKASTLERLCDAFLQKCNMSYEKRCCGIIARIPPKRYGSHQTARQKSFKVALGASIIIHHTASRRGYPRIEESPKVTGNKLTKCQGVLFTPIHFNVLSPASTFFQVLSNLTLPQPQSSFFPFSVKQTGKGK